ncbi:SCO family protein [Litorivicinus sp.]|nr:SCO family protein [Litorivicinus sp.]
MGRYAPLILAALLSGLVAWPFVRNLTGTENQGMPGVQIGGHFALQTVSGIVDTKTIDRDVFLIYFGYTYCPDVCPTELARMVQVIKGLDSDGSRVKGIFVTVDPKRDTVDAVTAYVRAFDSDLIGMTGDEGSVRRVMAQYQVYAKKVGDDETNYLVDHISRIYVVNREAQLMALFAMDTDISAMIEKIRSIL